MSAYTNSVWFKLIFPMQFINIRRGRWAHAYLGNANCWYTVDIICQHLSDSASTSRASCTVSNWSSDNELASPMSDSSRLERGVVPDWQAVLLHNYQIMTVSTTVYTASHCLERNMSNTTRWHPVCYRHDIHYYLYNYAWRIFLTDSLNDLQCKTCLISTMQNKHPD